MITKEYDICLEAAGVKKMLTTSKDERLDGLIEELVIECNETARPMVAFDTFDVVSSTEDAITLGVVGFDSNFLYRCLRSRKMVHPFVMTLGKGTDKALEREDVLSQYILDVLYNITLIKMERRLRSDIKDKYDYGHVSKLSPGSLDFWPIGQQLPLFELLAGGVKAIDVELDGNCIMHPSKSLSGIVFPTKIPFSSCIFCSMHDCPGREQPYEINKMEHYLAKR